MATPKITKVASVQILEPNDDHSDHDFDRTRTTKVHRRTRTLAVEVEEVVEITSSCSSKAERRNAP